MSHKKLKQKFSGWIPICIALAIIGLITYVVSSSISVSAQSNNARTIPNPGIPIDADMQYDLDNQDYVIDTTMADDQDPKLQKQGNQICVKWPDGSTGQCTDAGTHDNFIVEPVDGNGNGTGTIWKKFDNCYWGTQLWVHGDPIEVDLLKVDDIAGESPIWCSDGEVVLLPRGSSTFHNGQQLVEITLEGKVVIDGVEQDTSDVSTCGAVLDRKSGDLHRIERYTPLSEGSRDGLNHPVLQLLGHGYGYELLNRFSAVGVWTEIMDELCPEEEATATPQNTATSTPKPTATNTPQPTATTSQCPNGVIVPNDQEGAHFMKAGDEVEVFNHSNAGGRWVLRHNGSSMQLVRNGNEVMQDFAAKDTSTGGLVLFEPRTGTLHIEYKPEGNVYSWQLDVPNWNPHFITVDRIDHNSALWSCVEKIILRPGESYVHHGVPVGVREDGACFYGDTEWCSRGPNTSTCAMVFDTITGAAGQLRRLSFTEEGVPKSRRGDIGSVRFVGVTTSPDGTEQVNSEHGSPTNFWLSMANKLACPDQEPPKEPTATMSPTPSPTATKPTGPVATPTKAKLYAPILKNDPTATPMPPTATPQPRVCINARILVNGNAQPNILDVRFGGVTNFDIEWDRSGGAIEPSSIEWTLSLQNDRDGEEGSQTNRYKLYRIGTRQPGADWTAVEDPTKLSLVFKDEFDDRFAAGANATLSGYPFYSDNPDVCPQGTTDFHVDP